LAHAKIFVPRNCRQRTQTLDIYRFRRRVQLD